MCGIYAMLTVDRERLRERPQVGERFADVEARAAAGSTGSASPGTRAAPAPRCRAAAGRLGLAPASRARARRGRAPARRRASALRAAGEVGRPCERSGRVAPAGYGRRGSPRRLARRRSPGVACRHASCGEHAPARSRRQRASGDRGGAIIAIQSSRTVAGTIRFGIRMSGARDSAPRGDGPPRRVIVPHARSAARQLLGRYDYTTVGHVTVDVMADGSRRARGNAPSTAPCRRAGSGCARSSSRAACATRSKQLLEPYRSELELDVQPAAQTTTLPPPAAAPRAAQRLLAWAGPIEGELALDTAILHLAPVARESPAAWPGTVDFVGLTPQGLVRRWRARRR